MTENHDAATGHVFTAVVTNAFDYRTGTGVAHGEPLRSDASDIRFTAGCAIQNDIASYDIFFRCEGAFLRWIQNDLAAGQTFTDVVIRVTFYGKRDAFRQPCPQALTG